MQRQLRVDTAGVQTMANRWDASAGELDITAPAALGLSCQASVAAVNVAHADVKAFTAALKTQMSSRATAVTRADTCYVANEADSAGELAAVAPPVAGT
jgi:Holliday junction resolvase-like predicted endonuclease